MKLFFTLMLICFVSGAFADDTGQVVSDRMSCADISARVSEIGKIDEPTEAETAELTKLKAEYRRICTKSARGRRISGEARIVVESTAVPEEVETVVEDVVQESPEDEAEQESVVQQEVVEIDPMIELEQELANLDAGLCADGSQPNKFGCCGDEVFKDLGNTVFACCPKEGVGDCFPPLK